MNVACPECGSVFRVDPAKIPEGGVRARCSICGGIIPLARESADASLVVAAPAPSPADPQADPLGVGNRDDVEEALGAAAPMGDDASRLTAGTRAASPSIEQDDSLDRGSDSEGDRYAAPSATESVGTAVGGDEPPFGVTESGAAAGGVTSGYGNQPTPTGRRPINPFLNNDPGMKAKRLARALVSDMITYQPQKREEGLRNGTLKQLFREEIKKSYEEYVEQVGRDVAESTAHFQEALNDILANGRKVF